ENLGAPFNPKPKRPTVIFFLAIKGLTHQTLSF
ncbi:MAG: hypothetical protein AVDCRST_MAG93-5505, partial [uncultured Chloroflexia bacterium]